MLVDFGKALMTAGVLLTLAGGLVILAARIPGLGLLPGDLVWRKNNVTFYFPLMTCFVLSLLMSLGIWFFRR